MAGIDADLLHRVRRLEDREAVVPQFHGRFAALGATCHYSHDHLLEFDPHDLEAARGIGAARTRTHARP